MKSKYLASIDWRLKSRLAEFVEHNHKSTLHIRYQAVPGSFILRA